MARYKNLHELIYHSSSTRKYFLSLPVRMQMELHKSGDYIKTADQLRRYEYSLRSCGSLND